MDLTPTLRRTIEPALRRAIRTFPVVVLTGPRQAGKTTLVRDGFAAADRLYLTLDDLDVLGDARHDPDRLIARAERMTIDEVQRAPELLLAVKREVDRRRRPGRFLLTGSADLRQMRDVADLLPGRAVYLDLEPMSAAELRGDPDHESPERLLLAGTAVAARDAARAVRFDAAGSIRRGGLPPAALLDDDDAREAWFDSYVRTWLERGVTDLARLAELPDLRRLMLVAATRTGGLLNQADAARDAGLPRTTAHRYLALLSAARLLELLPGWARNPSVRLTKAPKLYWRDAGLAAHLARFGARDELASHPAGGPLLENLVLSNLRAWASARKSPPRFFHWRTAGGREIDLVLEFDDRLVPIEVKTGARVRDDDARHLRAFLDEEAKSAAYGVLLHGGSTPQTLCERVVALPIGALL